MGITFARDPQQSLQWTAGDVEEDRVGNTSPVSITIFGQSSVAGDVCDWILHLEFRNEIASSFTITLVSIEGVNY